MESKPRPPGSAAPGPPSAMNGRAHDRLMERMATGVVLLVFVMFAAVIFWRELTKPPEADFSTEFMVLGTWMLKEVAAHAAKIMKERDGESEKEGRA